MAFKLNIEAFAVDQNTGKLLPDELMYAAYRTWIGLAQDEEVTPLEVIADYQSRDEFKEFLAVRYGAHLVIKTD
jgi:hypothetical protein